MIEEPPLPEGLHGHPWRSHSPALSRTPPTMLAPEELSLLHWLAARHYSGEGVIVDGGPFLGGSTHALAAGLAENPAAPSGRPAIHSFDLFNTTSEFFDPNFALYGLRPGESFLPLYRQHLAPFLARIAIHEGDLLRQSWSGGKIEILFLDCAKTPALHDHAVKIWFPHLIPGRSVLVQQDYGYWHYSWGNITMEVFREHFVVLDDLPDASRVYLCTREIPAEKAGRLTYASLTGDERLRCMEAALKTVTREDFRSRMLVNHAIEASQQGRADLCREIVLSIFTTPRVDLVDAVVAQLFPEYANLRPPKPRHSLGFKLKRETRRVLRQFGLVGADERNAARHSEGSARTTLNPQIR